MEHHDPSRTPFPPQSYQPQAPPQQGQVQPTGPYATPESVSRFRSSYLQQSPPLSSSARAPGDAQQAYGFAAGGQYDAGAAMPSASLQYAQDMHAQDAQRQSYPHYGTPVVYSMPQAQPTQPTQSPFEQAPQYRQRANTATEALASPFGVPPPPQYYMHGQPGPAGPVATNLPGPQMPTQYQPQDYGAPGPSAAPSYPNPIIDPTPTGSFQYGHQGPYAAPQQPQSEDPGLERYRMQIQSTFSLARDGSLREVQGQLLQATHFLLGNVETLGLTRDDETQHDNRIRLWDEFNAAWLVTLQRQIDLTEEIRVRGQPLPPPQSIMSEQTLDYLGSELVRLCDGIERHGLVDYQMGVLEEEITDLVARCARALRELSGPSSCSAATAAPDSGAQGGDIGNDPARQR